MSNTVSHPGLKIKVLKFYNSKSEIEDIGEDGWNIPDGIPLVEIRTTDDDGKYNHWHFVAYQENLDQFLCTWIAAKSLGAEISLRVVDRGNFLGPVLWN